MQGGISAATAPRCLSPAVENVEPRRQDLHSQDAQDAEDVENVFAMDTVTSGVYRIHRIVHLRFFITRRIVLYYTMYRICSAMQYAYLHPSCCTAPYLHSACTYHIL